MRYRLLGRTGLRVSELFLGAMGFEDLKRSRDLVDVYADAGGNVVDTANSYGESEKLVGEILQGRRDRFVLATKYTCSRDPSDPNGAGNHRKNLTLSLDESLRRLRTDHIDLYWVHVWDRHTPVEEMMRALDDAVRAGKIGYVGISDAPAWVVARANTLAEWRGWTPFAGIQVPYNLLQRDVERELLPMAEGLGLSVAAWAPLARGVLSGRASDSLSDRDRAVTTALQDVAGELGATPAQVALAWTWSGFRGVHPIVGASRVEQLRDNLGAVDVDLPDEAVQRLNAAAPFDVGFPSGFIAQCEASSAVFGAASKLVT